MKTSGTMDGGSLSSSLLNTCGYDSFHQKLVTNAKSADATYLLRCLQGFQNKGIPLYAISIQNEPQNSNPTYPTATLTAAQEAQIGMALRSLMNNNGFGCVRLIGMSSER